MVHKQQWFKLLEVAHRCQLVKASEQLVQRHDQLLGRTLRCQAGEAFNICKQYATGKVIVEVSKEMERDTETQESDNEFNQ